MTREGASLERARREPKAQPGTPLCAVDTDTRCRTAERRPSIE